MTDEPSIPCEWNGKVYDLDLTSYVGLELDELEKRTGETWRRTYVASLTLKPDGLRAPFWLTDRRADPGLKWSEYAGPPARVVMPHIESIRQALWGLGKALTAGMTTQEILADIGSEDSPSTADTPPADTTGSPAPTGS